MHLQSSKGGKFGYEYFLKFANPNEELTKYSVICDVTVNVCYPTCKTCKDYGTPLNEKCSECKAGLYKTTTNKCSTIELLGGKYYLDTADNYLKNCNSICKTCKGPTEEDCPNAKWGISRVQRTRKSE